MKPEETEYERKDRLRKEVDAMPGLKQRELQACLLCNRGVGHNRDLDFYRLTLERFFINPGAVQRQHGYELMMGGGQQGAVLASIMGTDPDLAKQVSTYPSFIICSSCAMEKKIRIAHLAENLSEREKP